MNGGLLFFFFFLFLHFFFALLGLLLCDTVDVVKCFLSENVFSQVSVGFWISLDI
jgi:hypothetical protein